jgi:hypothetical protein
MPARPLAVALVAASALAAPAAADYRLEKQLPLAPGGELVVSSEGGGITVVGDSPGGVHVVITSEDDDAGERYAFDFDAQPGRVTVSSKRKRGSGTWWDWSGRHGVRMEIHTPRRTSIDLRSSGGGLRVSRTEGDVHLRSSGGGLRISDVKGTIDGETSGGSITVHRVEGDLRLDTSGGGVEIVEVIGNVEAGSSGGGITVENVAGEVDVSTSGGGVRVGLLPSARVTLDASSSGGSVTCDLPVTVRGKISRSSLRGELNGGGHLYRLRSSGGGIRIRPAGMDG